MGMILFSREFPKLSSKEHCLQYVEIENPLMDPSMDGNRQCGKKNFLKEELISKGQLEENGYWTNLFLGAPDWLH